MRCVRTLLGLLSLPALLATLAACGAHGTSDSGSAAPPTAPVVRRGFLGAFFRPVGSPPFGVFSVFSKQTAPEPYPHASTTLFGTKGYCDAVAANGVSIAGGYKVDAAKVSNIVKLGVKWARMPISSYYDDKSHVYGAGSYLFSDMDSAQCALVRAHIEPIVGIDAGPVEYNSIPGSFSPQTRQAYKTAADFGDWCGVVARHERDTFASVHRFSIPGNEVNGDAKMFPEVDQIAAYSKACYRAIKAAVPHSTVYGFELNMEQHLEPVKFVQRMYDLGCRPGTCYDAIALHLFVPYPIPPLDTPCHPQPSGNYRIQCITDIQQATHAPAMHVLIGETVFLIPATVPDEATKAKAVVEEMNIFAGMPLIDGVNYANVDECDLYPSGYFVGGCLIDSLGNALPAYTALQELATKYY